LREITVNSDFFFLNQTQSRNSELKKMETKCFVCSSNEIQKSCSASVDLESSFMLFQILEIPQRMSLIRELIKSQIMKYCSDCLGRILKITDMLNELKKLEKKKYYVKNDKLNPNLEKIVASMNKTKINLLMTLLETYEPEHFSQCLQRSVIRQLVSRSEHRHQPGQPLRQI